MMAEMTTLLRFLIISLLAITIIMALNKPSPHRFKCPPKNSPGGMPEIMKCANKWKFMLDQVCLPKYGLPTDLIQNLLKHVFFHAIKCIDADYEHLLVDGVVECMVGDNSPGTKMMCNVKSSMCNKQLQGEMTACALNETTMHSVDMAKMMTMLGHLSKLCDLLAVGTHREAKAKWKDFPALP